MCPGCAVLECGYGGQEKRISSIEARKRLPDSRSGNHARFTGAANLEQWPSGLPRHSSSNPSSPSSSTDSLIPLMPVETALYDLLGVSPTATEGSETP
ncbi:hypothetical protein C8Q80DRAFT_627054 [Daedaleopsis nitida]|nr:hypothetical protein C8Q80DRAFT_627054 [Daedaleopsis nitida]